jgi:ComF family protein
VKSSEIVKSVSTLIKDALWPADCIICGRDENLSEGDVCEFCWNSLVPATNIAPPGRIKRLMIGFGYDDTLRQIVHRFKFEHVSSLANPLSDRLIHRINNMGGIKENSILLPVPDHPTRRRERGFNPAGELAKNIAIKLNLDYRPELAKRVIAGPHQSMLPDKERKTSLQNVFSVIPPNENEKYIPLVIVDDVVHTGTTLKRLANVAYKSGWRRIEALSLCS